MDPFGSIPNIILTLVILSILVVVHEWGHFIVARLFKIRVDDFSIGFGKRLIRLGKRGDTEYNIRMLPLGGFVKIAGMDPDEEPLIRAKDAIIKKKSDNDPDAKEMPLVAENLDTFEETSADDEFNGKPIWQRSLVIFAGPFMSFAFGYIVLCLTGWLVGLPTGKITNRIGMVYANGPAMKMGLHAGDRITSINGMPISDTDGSTMIRVIRDSLGKPLTLTINSNGKVFTKTAVPIENRDEKGRQDFVHKVVTPGALGSLGIMPGDYIYGYSLNGKKQELETNAIFLKTLAASAGSSIKLIIDRPGSDREELKGVIPQIASSDAPVLNEYPAGILKFLPDAVNKRTSFVQSIKAGNEFTIGYFQTLGELIHSNKLHQNAGGILRIYQATKIAAANGLSQLFLFGAQISICLAVFNLFPIPILDGGHLLAFFIEWVRRGKKMSPQVYQAFLMTGLAIILLLVIAVNLNDIIATLHHQVQQ